MAVQAGIFSPSQDPNVLTTVATGNASAWINLAAHRLVAITSDQTINIKFTANNGAAVATSSDFRLAAGAIYTYDTGKTPFFSFFNNSGNTANCFIQFLVKG